MKSKILIPLFLFASLQCLGQTKQKTYWKALMYANEFYNDADYENAVAAYNSAFELMAEDDYARHRLFAAAANCMIGNEEGVRTNLFALLPLSTKDDMRRVLVNYELFAVYYETTWWKDLKAKMDARLADLIAHHKNLRVFKKGRNLRYKATRVNNVGDTLANTFITLKPDGTGWGDEAASLQSQIIYEYEYSSQDSAEHIDELRRIVTTDFWTKVDTTGIIENDEQVWMHPMRYNEFFKTELAPFPTVQWPISSETVEKANSKIMILNSWGTYSSSETENEYTYVGKELRSYSGIGDLDCYKFKAHGFNNFHGLSHIEYYFNEDLGFVEMNYLTYDEDKIDFILDEIVVE